MKRRAPNTAPIRAAQIFKALSANWMTQADLEVALQWDAQTLREWTRGLMQEGVLEVRVCPTRTAPRGMRPMEYRLSKGLQ